jgi:hypothetical protein
MSQHIFKNGQSYYLAEISPQGQLTLKVKEFGWSDTWSLPLEACDHLGRTHEELTVGDCNCNPCTC